MHFTLICSGIPSPHPCLKEVLVPVMLFFMAQQLLGLPCARCNGRGTVFLDFQPQHCQNTVLVVPQTCCVCRSCFKGQKHVSTASRRLTPCETRPGSDISSSRKSLLIAQHWVRQPSIWLLPSSLVHFPQENCLLGYLLRSSMRAQRRRLEPYSSLHLRSLAHSSPSVLTQRKEFHKERPTSNLCLRDSSPFIYWNPVLVEQNHASGGLRALPEACEVPGGSAQQGMAASEF